MNGEQIIEKLVRKFGSVITETNTNCDLPTVVADVTVIREVIAFLKDDPELQFTFLTDLTGIHYPDRKLPLGVIYHLHSFLYNQRIRVKTFVTLENPVVPSMTGLFSSANWMERETYDFFGILFEGHPNLKRILNVDYMDYFPMRKEYPLEDQTREDKDDRFFGR